MSSNQTEMLDREQEMTAADAVFAEEAAEGTVSGYKKIERGVVAGYKKIENGVVAGYQKIERGVVKGFCNVMDKCVEVLFARNGESVEDAKVRLAGKNRE